LNQCNAALSSDIHSAFLEGIKSAMSGTMKTLLVDCKVSPAVAFGAPITEAYCIKLKEAGELESYVKIASEAEKLLPSIDGIRVPVSWGVGIDAPDMIGAVVGWDTVQVRFLIHPSRPLSEINCLKPLGIRATPQNDSSRHGSRSRTCHGRA